MKVCWIEDHKHIVEGFQISLQESKANFEVIHLTDFDLSLQSLHQHDHSILILDLKNEQTNQLDGKTILSKIFSNSYTPVIIHSALPETNIPAEILAHPLVEYVQKGVGAPAILLSKLNEIKEKIGFMSEMKSISNDLTLMLLVDWYPALSRIQIPESLKSNLFIRRFAAALDFAFHLKDPEKKIDPAEMYLYPALPNTDLLTGDILKKTDADIFFLVISPSCDLDCRGGKGPKTSRVLVAKMDKAEAYIATDNKFKNCTTESGLLEKIDSQLKSEPLGGKILLPRLNSTDLPGFCVNLKELDFIQMDKISFRRHPVREFIRVASIDSPFRENISDMIGKELGRIGIPEVSLEKWANDYWGIHPNKAEADRKAAEKKLQEERARLKAEAKKTE